jgi:hypothetical protein
MKSKNIIYLLLASFLIINSLNSCKKNNPDPNPASTTNTDDDENANTDDDSTNSNPEEELDYPFTLSDNKTMHRLEVDGVVYSGEVSVVNSLNNGTLAAIGFLGNGATTGGVPWLPKKTGTFVTGHELSNVAGSATSKAKMTMHIRVGGKDYFAYSSNAYGNTNESLVPGSEAVITVKKFEGDYVAYTLYGYRVSAFIGKIDFLFEGTFKTLDGSETIIVKKGECRIAEELPVGAEIVQ